MMTILEVSQKYGLSRDTLRYYEKEGLIPPVPRKKNGIRDYDEVSCGWVEFARCMRRVGIPVERLALYVRLYRKGDSTREERRQLLKEEYARMNARITEMQEMKQRLEEKIMHYDEMDEAMVHGFSKRPPLPHC